MGTTGQSITLANSIIGVGILAMPFCFQQCGVILASLILLFMGLVSRLCCHYLLKSALIARRRNFEFLAFHVFGSAGKLAVEVGIIGFLMGTCIAYFVVVGDLGPQIIAKMLNINQSDILRTSIMVIVSLVCILPLGLLRNVDSLSNVSAATIGFYVCLVIKVITEAASQLLAGDWHTKVAMWKPSGLLQCVPIFSMALFCQTQLFEVFDSMSYLSLEKMNVVTKNAINICTVVYFTLGLFGYIAFCSQTISGNILMSLSQTMASDVIKLGFVMSVAFSFPLIIFPCRASLYSLLYRKVHPAHHDHIINHSIPETTFRCITVAIIVVSLFISLLIPNIELVLGFVGSTIGVIICILFPAACFINVTFKDTNERLLAKAVIVLGLVILVLGTYANLQAAEHQPDKYDERYITQERIDKIVEDFFEAKRLKNADDVIQKPLQKVEASQEKNVIKASKEVKFDSEFQPPNPVPPQAQSEEKPQKEAPKLEKDKQNEKFEGNIDKPETHPKDVITKLNNEGLLINGEAKKKENAEKAKLDKKLQDDLDMKKQQQLIETIKQHDQEQKELMKEQKEILDEIKIIKDAEKPPPVKSDLDPVETKKLAVESIQKIADAAIHRLSVGVSDKPVNQEIGNKDIEPLHNIANNAVKEIAEKAVETIVAIQETVKEEQTNQKANLPKAPVVNKAPVQNNIVQQNQQVNPQNTEVNQQVQANINNINQQAVPNNSNIVQNIVNNIPNPVQTNLKPEIVSVNDKPVQNVIENARVIENIIQKEHSHSPDEPQSYKRGEDQQKPKADDVNPVSNGDVQNLPLAVALNANTHLKNNEEQKAINGKLIDTNPAEVKDNIKVEAENHLRAKREVVDCSKKNSLKPEDKEICETLVDKPVFKEPQDILPMDVNFNNAIRSPIDTNIILRSLKSIDEKGR